MYFSSDSTVPPSNSVQEPERLSESAPAAKDTVSWQEGLDKDLPGIPSAVYVGRSSHVDDQTGNTKVSLHM